MVKALGGLVAVGARTAPSRAVFGPHETNLARGRALGERHVPYYAARARGGAGVIVTEIASVHDSDHPYERAPLASECEPGWTAVAAACRPHRTLVMAGLGHAGGQGASAYHQRALWAPSRVPDPVTREVPMEMERPEIDELVAGFAAAAALAVHSGLDGVEINAGQHALLRQFLSGLTNRRDDGYGRDRGLLLREVLAAARTAMGDGPVLGLRLCGDELAPWAGITPAQGVAIAAAVAPLVDYLVVVRGCALSAGATRPGMRTEPGFNRGLCAEVRRGCGGAAAVVLQGSIVDPAMAQAALDDGTADLVELTRAQITCPDLVERVREGRPERIRPATLSQARTAVRDPRNFLISDDAEPDACNPPATQGAGDPDSRTSSPRLAGVLVVGGGPAGLEAARELALAGRAVRLVERSTALGGALRLAAALPGRGRFAELVQWWERELARLGVVVELDTDATPADLDQAAAVVLATGGRDRAAGEGPVGPGAAGQGPVAQGPGGQGPGGQGSAGRGTVSAGVVAAGARPAGPVLVDDPVGGAVGAGVAELLAATGREVRIVTPDPVVATQLGDELAEVNAHLQRLGVVRELRSRIVRVGDGTAELEHVWTGERRRVPAATVVDCGHRLPDDRLWRARPHLVRVGDCVAPRSLAEAVREGRAAAACC